jgi:hypothetical protein
MIRSIRPQPVAASLQLTSRLPSDPDPRVRRKVAGKRKLDEEIFAALAKDRDEGVRFAVLNDAKCPLSLRRTHQESL